MSTVKKCYKGSASEGKDTYINEHRGGTSDNNKNGAHKTALDAMVLCRLDVT